MEKVKSILNNFPREVAAPARRALASIGVTRVEQLVKFSEAELKSLHGMGPKALTALKKVLKEKGLSLLKK